MSFSITQDGQTIYSYPFNCQSCKNLILLSEKKCKAFDEIPESILMRGVKHSKPLPGQKNNIVFEPIKK